MASYLETFRRVNDTEGAELSKAQARVFALADQIKWRAPGFDWPGLWRYEGVTFGHSPSPDTPSFAEHVRNCAQRDRQPAARSREWNAETVEAIAWLETAPTPEAPFRLDAQRMVSDPAVFLARLQADVAAGPGGPRARTGALQADLLTLRALMAGAPDTGAAGTVVPEEGTAA